MNKDRQQLSWAVSLFLIALECLLALIIFFIVWCLYGISYLIGIKETYAEWSWYKFSVFLIFWAAFSIYIDIREMRKKPVDAERK